MYQLTQQTYEDTPDNLRAGSEVEFITAQVTLAAASGALVRGTVLGQITAGGNFVTSLSAAENGSEDPSVILLHDVPNDAGTQQVTVLLAGIVNEADLTFGTGHDAASVRWPLRSVGIYLRQNVGA